MIKNVKQETSNEERTQFSAVEGLIRARELAKKILGDESPATIFAFYDFFIDDDGTVDQAALDDLMKAKEVAASDLFKGIKFTPADVVDVYVRMFVGDDDDEE
jgi:hypothetical protein